MDKLSFIVPVYNSEGSLAELIDRVFAVSQHENWEVEIIFVDDFSKDKSWEVLCELQSAHPQRIQAVRLSKNFGQHNATICGIEQATGDYVITIDDDLQIPPEEVPKLYEHMKRADCEIVYGVYGSKKHKSYRNLGSNVVNWTVRKAFNTTGNITSFRMMTANLAASLVKHKQSHVFLDGLIHWHTSYVGRVLVEHRAREGGSSGYSIKKLLALSANLLFGFTILPLKLGIFLGFFISLISFAFGILFAIRKILFNVPIGYTSIIVSVFFMGGITLIVLGVLGEYIGRVFSLLNDKPQFTIKKIKNNE